MDKQQRLLMLIQTGLIAKQISNQLPASHTINGVAGAMFIPPDTIPDDTLRIIRMAEDYISWQDGGTSPDWFNNEWIDKDW